MTAARGTPQAEGHIRPLDPFRDLGSVVELIGVAFGDRLDPAGKATLDRMRRFAHGGVVLQWVWAFLGRATVAPGLVWVADGRVVGNVSVRRARGSRGYLIGNVVVHPSRRGRGIGRALMERAIEAVSRRGARWVGLEVRIDNKVARGLYERLGFREVGRTRHLLRPASSGEVGPPPQSGRARRGKERHGDALIRLMKAVIPEEQRPLLEVQEVDYQPGWRRRLEHWLGLENEAWWVIEGDDTKDDEIEGAVRVVQKRGAFPHQMELLVRPEDTARCADDLVRRGVVSLGEAPNRPIETSLPGTMDALVATLEDEGFQELRVLIQMKRTIRHRVSVRLEE